MCVKSHDGLTVDGYGREVCKKNGGGVFSLLWNYDDMYDLFSFLFSDMILASFHECLLTDKLQKYFSHLT